MQAENPEREEKIKVKNVFGMVCLSFLVPKRQCITHLQQPCIIRTASSVRLEEKTARQESIIVARGGGMQSRGEVGLERGEN